MHILLCRIADIRTLPNRVQYLVYDGIDDTDNRPNRVQYLVCDGIDDTDNRPNRDSRAGTIGS